MNGYSAASRGMGLGGAVLGFVGGMVVWALFGNKIKEKVNQNRTYQEMKTQIMDRANSVKDMTETKYHQIVDEVSNTYAKAKGIKQNELSDMVSDLKFHWARIKDRWNEPPSSPPTNIGTAGLDDKFTDGYNFRT